MLSNFAVRPNVAARYATLIPQTSLGPMAHDILWFLVVNFCERVVCLTMHSSSSFACSACASRCSVRWMSKVMNQTARVVSPRMSRQFTKPSKRLPDHL